MPETASVRKSEWKIPADLADRRVEIIGPVHRKMIVSALNSGASVLMADFDDANSPSWKNNVEGQINLKDRYDRKIDSRDDETGKNYLLSPNPAILIVRSRGWHLLEESFMVGGEPISGDDDVFAKVRARQEREVHEGHDGT